MRQRSGAGKEECECASGGINCTFCFNCTLAKGKQCTPDSVSPTCCDSGGMFTTTDKECVLPGSKEKGYCNLGKCSKISCGVLLPKGGTYEILDQACGVSSSNPCRAACKSSKSTGKCVDTTSNLANGAGCKYAGSRGFCANGECKVPSVCGNGLRQTGEECECASGTTCRFCSKCKLAAGKQCTPDSIHGGTCCDSRGMFATTSVECVTADKKKGYCNAGKCTAPGCSFLSRAFLGM